MVKEDVKLLITTTRGIEKLANLNEQFAGMNKVLSSLSESNPELLPELEVIQENLLEAHEGVERAAKFLTAKLDVHFQGRE